MYGKGYRDGIVFSVVYNVFKCTALQLQCIPMCSA